MAGFGASAKTFHLPFLLSNPSFVVTAVLERQAKEAPVRLPSARVHQTLESFLGDREWDLAVITLPNDLHAPVAVEVVRGGRPVVVEKPLAGTWAEAQGLVEAAARAGVAGFVYQNRRLDGDFQLVRELVRDGRLGRLVRVECRYDRWANALRKKAWKEEGRAGNTLLEDLGSHLVDQALTLFGAPRALRCRLGIQRDESRTPDAFRIELEYEGLWVDLESGMVVRQSPFHWSLQGTGGTFQKASMDPQEAQLQAGMSPLDEQFGVEDPSRGGWFYPALGDAVQLPTPRGRYADFYRDVADVLLRGTAPTFPLSDGAAVVRILESCRTSSAEGRTITL